MADTRDDPALFFIFMQFSGKNYQNNRLVSPSLEFASPLLGNLDSPLDLVLKPLNKDDETVFVFIFIVF